MAVITTRAALAAALATDWTATQTAPATTPHTWTFDGEHTLHSAEGAAVVAAASRIESGTGEPDWNVTVTAGAVTVVGRGTTFAAAVSEAAVVAALNTGLTP